MKTIGILGGMGPAASALFYQTIIETFQKKYGSVQDIDFPNIIINSLSLDGFDETGIVDEKLVLKQLIHGISVLNDGGVDFIVMPCNTVHHYYGELQRKSNVPIISIVQETVNALKVKNIRSVSLLGSETTMKCSFYQDFFTKEEISFVIPTEEEQLFVTALIHDVMSGKINSVSKEAVLDLINNSSGQAVVLGCTELPLAIKESNLEIFDSLKILAHAAVDYSVGKLNK